MLHSGQLLVCTLVCSWARIYTPRHTEAWLYQDVQRWTITSHTVCLPACLSVCTYVCLSVCLPICLYICLFVYLSVCTYICLPACLPAYLPVHMSVCLSACLTGPKVPKFVKKVTNPQ